MQRVLLLVGMAALALAANAQVRSTAADTAAARNRLIDREVAIDIVVPDGAWSVQIEEIWRVQGELWVFARASRPADVLAVQMRTKISDKIQARLPNLPLKFFALGKTWEWKNKEEVTWITEKSDELRERRQGLRLWRR